MSRNFSGTDQYITLPSSPDMGNMTILAWINISTLTNPYGYIVNRGNAAESLLNYYFRVHLNGSVLYGFTTGTSIYKELQSSTGEISTGTWYRLCARYNGSTQKIYKNGVEIATQNETGTPSQGFASPIHRIGSKTTTAPGEFLNGLCCEVVYYSRALSVQEISNDYRGRMAPNPLRYWPLYGHNSPEADLSGNASNGTVVGATLGDHAPIGRLFPQKLKGSRVIEAAAGGYPSAYYNASRLDSNMRAA